MFEFTEEYCSSKMDFQLTAVLSQMSLINLIEPGGRDPFCTALPRVL